MAAPTVICVVDDDESVRESLPDLLRACGYDAHAFGSAEELLASRLLPLADCLIVDVRMPRMGGRDLLMEVRRLGSRVPVVFITAVADSSTSGGGSFLSHTLLIKPFSEAVLLQALANALSLR